jgi:adenosylcobinamide-phosphate synthase
LGCEVALLSLAPNPYFLAAGVTLDLLLGDPEYRAHPVRLIGWSLTRTENLLRRIGLDGYGGGIALLLILSVVWVGGISTAIVFLPGIPAAIVSIFLVYSLLALRDLLRHGWNVERAAVMRDLPAARAAISKLVGRDTAKMDASACVRAAIESLTENLTDGFVSPVFWYALGGLPCLVLFKVVSTMDSMVGYKSERYLRFGWCGARSDDLMNWIPARITWLLISAVALLLTGYSARKSLRVGWRQHAVVPGPNSGWSEAAAAGAIQRRLIGPIWAGGKLVTEIWLGDPADPPAGGPGDFRRAAILVTAAAMFAVALAITTLATLERIRMGTN